VIIGQLLTPDAGFYERKHQILDASALEAKHQIHTWKLSSTSGGVDALAQEIAGRGCALLHLYGPIDVESLARLALPVIVPFRYEPPRRRWFSPRLSLPPLLELLPGDLPEAVDAQFMELPEEPAQRSAPPWRVATLGRGEQIEAMVQLSLIRLQRFRSDVEWHLLSAPPTARRLRSFDAWVDPAVDPADPDGFTAEAAAAGLPVVASRSPLNEQRLAGGEAGFLVPAGDPNELVHALLQALFNREATGSRLERAAARRACFSSAERAAALVRYYESVVP
jgi:glycosyltransferase involved in cell wall biosynthesis